jgi:hypothetical protein
MSNYATVTYDIPVIECGKTLSIAADSDNGIHINLKTKTIRLYVGRLYVGNYREGGDAFDGSFAEFRSRRANFVNKGYCDPALWNALLVKADELIGNLADDYLYFGRGTGSKFGCQAKKVGLDFVINGNSFILSHDEAVVLRDFITKAQQRNRP